MVTATATGTAVRERKRAKAEEVLEPQCRNGSKLPAATLGSAIALLLLSGSVARAEDPSANAPADYPVGSQTDTKRNSGPSSRARRPANRAGKQAEDDDLKITQEPAFKIMPSIYLRETYTDNVALRSGAGARADFVTEVAPDLALSYTGPNAVLFGRIGASNFSYGRDSNAGRTALRLNADLKAQPVENHFFLDANASVTEQAISSFATQESDTASVTSNRTEVRTFTLTPRLLGSIGDRGVWNLRVSNTSSSTDTAFVQRRNVSSWDGQLMSKGGKIGAGIGFNGNSIRISGASARGTDQVFGVLTYNPGPSLRLALRAGSSSDTYGTERRSKTSLGADLVWRPQPTADLRASYDRLSYGPRINLDLNYRRPLSAFNVRYSEDVVTSFTAPSQFAVPVSTAESLSIATLAYLGTQNVSITPDITNSVRAAAAQYVQENGLPETISTPLTTSGSGIYRQKRLEVTAALLGARNAMTLKAYRAQRSSVGSSEAVLNILDFLPVSLGTAVTDSTVDQSGGILGWDHRLTSLTGLAGRYSVARSESKGSTNLTSIARILDIRVYTRLSAHMGAELGVRHATQDTNTASSYTENALIGRISLQY